MIDGWMIFQTLEILRKTLPSLVDLTTLEEKPASFLGALKKWPAFSGAIQLLVLGNVAPFMLKSNGPTTIEVICQMYQLDLPSGTTRVSWAMPSFAYVPKDQSVFFLPGWQVVSVVRV